MMRIPSAQLPAAELGQGERRRDTRIFLFQQNSTITVLVIESFVQ